MTSVKRARNFFCTVQAGLKDGTKEEEENILVSWFNEWKITNSVQWAVFQLERGDGGRLHGQGCFVMKNAVTISTSNMAKIKLRAGVPEHTHIEVMRGTVDQAHKYCTKEDGRMEGTKPREFGVKPIGQGTRSDLIEFLKILGTEEMPWDEVDEREPVISSRHHALIRRLYVKAIRKCYRTERPKSIWLWGPSGAGKSWDAFHKYSKPEWMADGRTYLKSHNGGGAKWWCGFDPLRCKTVIMNDFRGGIEFSLLMQIADEHPMNVGIRGESDRPLKFDTLVITSVNHPKDVYAGVFEGEGGDEPYEQLERRFEIIKKNKRKSGLISK